MANSGLPAAIITETAIPTYYAPNTTVPGADFTQSEEPATTAAMQLAVSRTVTLPELAQLPDASYSMGDYLLGNEHCLASNIGRSSLDEIQACHNFASHMGAVNSTHFAPQNKAVYGVYHQLAKAIAGRCQLMQAAFTPAPPLLAHPLSSVNKTAIADCEREALAMQAVASHYLEDAWSSGHMWQRWGAPDFAPDLDGQLAALSVSMFSGMIHGWTGVMRGETFFDEIQDDRLVKPGPNDVGGQDYVRWTYPNSTGPLIAGGGDEYLIPCSPPAAHVLPHALWYVSTSDELKTQYQRMITCVGKGFAEVYDAGPQTGGARSDTQLSDAAVLTSQDDICWEQRVTNKSMALGIGMDFKAPNLPLLHSLVFNTGEFYAKLSHLTRKSMGVAVADTDTQAKALTVRMQNSMPDVVFEIKFRAGLKPDGTDAADLIGPELASLMGNNLNKAGVDDIENGKVPYLERARLDDWNGAVDDTCNSDTDCARGEYCAANALSGSLRYCARGEHAVMRAYRAAEQPNWCVYDKETNLQDAILGCTNNVGANVSCEACVDVVLAHVRNACDEASYKPQLPGITDGDQNKTYDHRAMCDVYGSGLTLAGGVDYVYLPYDPNVPDAARQAAMALCQSGDQLQPETFQYAESGFTPPATAQDIDGTAVCYENINTCGAGLGEQWFRFKQSKQSLAREHKLRVVATPLTDANGHLHQASGNDILLQAYAGPDCTKKIAEVPIWQWFAWDIAANTSDEICVRVKAQQYQVWTSYRLEEYGSCPIYAMDGDKTSAGQCQLDKIDPRSGQLLASRTVQCGDVKFDGSGSHLYRTATGTGLFEIDTQTLADKQALWTGAGMRIWPGHQAHIVTYLPDPAVSNVGTVRYFGPLVYAPSPFSGYVWIGDLTGDDLGFFDSFTFQDGLCAGDDCYFPALARYAFADRSTQDAAEVLPLFCGPKPDGTLEGGLNNCGIKPPNFWVHSVAPTSSPDGTKKFVSLPLGQVGIVDVPSMTQLSASYLPWQSQSNGIMSPDNHTAAWRIEGTDPVTQKPIGYVALFDYSSGTLQQTIELLDYGKPENFIIEDFNNDGSKVFISYMENGTTPVIVGFDVITGAALYRVPLAYGVTALAVRR